MICSGILCINPGKAFIRSVVQFIPFHWKNYRQEKKNPAKMNILDFSDDMWAFKLFYSRFHLHRCIIMKWRCRCRRETQFNHNLMFFFFPISLTLLYPTASPRLSCIHSISLHHLIIKSLSIYFSSICVGKNLWWLLKRFYSYEAIIEAR